MFRIMENEKECKLKQTTQNLDLDTEQGAYMTSLVKEQKRRERNKKTGKGKGGIYSSQTT